jgi:hypothetical protein
MVAHDLSHAEEGRALVRTKAAVGAVCDDAAATSIVVTVTASLERVTLPSIPGVVNVSVLGSGCR